MNELLKYVLPFGVATIISFLLIPLWIAICKKWHLFDEPDSRKHHKRLTPSMGGIAVFAGITISFLGFCEIEDYSGMQYLLAASIILFFTGFFDDLIHIKPGKKYVFQLIAATVLYYGGYRISTLFGFTELGELPVYIGYPVTLFIVSLFTNAFNFIDGVDGLAASIGVIIASSLGVLFVVAGKEMYAALSFCLAGAQVGFLLFNFHPARIFMGDTGSLVIGILLIALSIELYQHILYNPDHGISLAIIPAVLFFPFFDLMRVLVIRMINGNSPFTADRSHLHHKFISLGFGHSGTTIFLSAIASSVIALQVMLKELDTLSFILLATLYCLIFTNSIIIKMLAGVKNRITALFQSAGA